MSSQRRRYSAEFKARVALEAIKGHMTINELASQFGVHPNLVTQWKKYPLACLPQLFANRPLKAEHERERFEAALYQQIGQLKVELDWVKKKLGRSLASKRGLIEPVHPNIPVSRQCELVGLARSSYYYAPARESPENLHLMRLIDEQYTRTRMVKLFIQP
jgi:putative transposase